MWGGAEGGGVVVRAAFHSNRHALHFASARAVASIIQLRCARRLRAAAGPMSRGTPTRSRRYARQLSSCRVGGVHASSPVSSFQ